VTPADNAGRSNDASTARRIEQLLREQLRPVALEVRDESAAHAGHAGGGGKGHFRVRIVSTSFVGLTPLQRHRRIHAVLASLWQHELHALAMEALTPDEVTN
jgi:BolA family transcriptional regulator, general stress-responsive regulator